MIVLLPTHSFDIITSSCNSMLFMPHSIMTFTASLNMLGFQSGFSLVKPVRINTNTHTGKEGNPFRHNTTHSLLCKKPGLHFSAPENENFVTICPFSTFGPYPWKVRKDNLERFILNPCFTILLKFHPRFHPSESYQENSNVINQTSSYKHIHLQSFQCIQHSFHNRPVILNHLPYLKVEFRLIHTLHFHIPGYQPFFSQFTQMPISRSLPHRGFHWPSTGPAASR